MALSTAIVDTGVQRCCRDACIEATSASRFPWSIPRGAENLMAVHHLILQDWSGQATCLSSSSKPRHKGDILHQLNPYPRLPEILAKLAFE